MYSAYSMYSQLCRDPRQQQFELKAQLREGLRSLPAPRNDFEIVVPQRGEGGEDGEEGGDTAGFVEDAGDVDERNAQLKREEGMDGWIMDVKLQAGKQQRVVCSH